MNTLKLTGKDVLRTPVTRQAEGSAETLFEVIRDGDSFVVSLKETAGDENFDIISRSLSTYMQAKSHRFTHFEMDRLPHDLVLGSITLETPRRLADVLVNKYNIRDNQTPDQLTETYCFELGTSVKGSITAFDAKKAKYSKMCEERGLKYYVMGVGHMEVTTNFDITDDEAMLVSSLYVLGRKIQNEASLHGFEHSKSIDDLEKTFKFSMMNVIENHPKTVLNIEKEEWDRWSKHGSDKNYNLNEMETDIYNKLVQHSSESIIQKLSGQKNNKLGLVKDMTIREEYLKKVDSFETRPANDKKRLPIPFCNVDTGNFVFKGKITADTAIGELWSSIRDSYTPRSSDQHYSTYVSKDYDKNLEFDLRMSKEHKISITEKNRVKVILTEKAKMSLAENGYLAKKLKKAEKATNVQTSLGYSLTKDYDMQDFEEFINNTEMLEGGYCSRKWENLTTLLMKGGFSMSDKSVEFVRDFTQTKLGSCAEFISSLFSEINLNYRKPTKGNEYIVNPIPNYKALLAIHNTGSNKHTFYTVLVHKSDFHLYKPLSKIFRMWVDVGDFYALDLSSTRRHDISNMLFCTSKIVTMLATHMEVFGCKLEVKENFNCSQEFYFHLLVYLENHNQTSETLQQVRFFYMKTNSSKMMPETLLSPVEKLPEIIRSRFCAFAIKRIISSFLAMSISRDKILNVIAEKDQEMEEENFSEDVLSGVTSYISGNKLKNYEEALLLSYGGIYHNKEKLDNVTSNLQIYRKLTKEELKINEKEVNELKNGYRIEDSMKMPPHGFSGEHLRNCGLALLEDMKKRGLSFGDLKQKIASSLNEVTFEELATFKASLDSNHLEIDSPDKDFKEAYPDLRFNSDSKTDRGKYKYGKSSRALEGVLKVLMNMHADENVKPFHMISDLINLCNERGGIVAILFKKAQFGSVREIFILTMFARIVVKFVETVARTIAECCPNEYLTKGSSKLNSTPTHYNKVKSNKRTDDIVLNMFDSLDCKTWCQNFTFPAFGNLFSVIFREWPEISNVIRVVFNMASSKRHEMTETLMTLFLKHQEVNSTSDSMNVLKKEFLSRDKGKLNKGNQSIFVNNVSNFMQGIFHYTSTVLHSSHLIMMTKVIRGYVLRGESSVRTFIHTTKASSDDGSSLMSVILKKPTKHQVAKMRYKLFVASEMLCRSYPLACAWIGEPKSTRFVDNGVEEFNSLWSYRNTVLSVPSKFTAAAVCPKITRSTIERQRVDHNSMNSCIENGCSMRLTKIIELSCAINHYIIVGLDSYSSETWESFVNNVIEVPHPASWLYICSPRLIGPTLGFDVTLHNFLNNCVSARKVHYVVTQLLAGSFDIKSGFLIQSSIVIGSLTKYKDFLDRISKTEDISAIEKTLDERPVMLYRNSNSLEEVKQKIILKAKSSGAERSFIFEDESAIHSISSYLISSPSLTVSKKLKDSEDWERRKMSLPAYISMLQKTTTGAESINEIEPHSKSLLQMLSLYSDNLMPIGRRRKVPVKIRFPKTRSETDISLQSAAKFKWFSIFNGYDESQNLGSFSEYQKLYSWLGDTYNDTVANIRKLGVDGNVHMTIFGLLMTESDKDRTVSFMHAGRKESTMITSFLSCIEYCQEKGEKLIRPNHVYAETDLGRFIEIERKLFPYISIHPKVRQLARNDKSDALEASKEIIEEEREVFLKPRLEREVRFLPRRLKNLLTIGTCMLKGNDPSEIQNVLMNYSHGFVITYIEQQRRIKDEEGSNVWVGPGSFHVKTTTVNFIIKCVDDTLTEVHSSQPHKITQHTSLLSRIFKILRLKKDVQNTLNGAEGVKIANRQAYYSTSKGVLVKQMSFTDDLKVISFETRFEVKNNGVLEMQINTVNKVGKMKAEPIRFKPSVPASGDCVYKLDFNTARSVIMSTLNVDESNTVWKFCQDSILDRLNRLKFFEKKKLKNLQASVITSGKVSYEEVRDDIYAMFTGDMLTMADISNLFDIGSGSEDGDSSEDFYDMTQEDAEMENLIDEADIFAVVKNVNSQSNSFEDLILWDDFINEFKANYKFSFAEMLTGDYFPPSTGKAAKVFEALRKLKIIPDHKPFESDDDDDEIIDIAD